MRETILLLIEKDSRLTAKELAVLIGATEEEVAIELKSLTDERIICGYNTLINWEKTEKEFVTALIEVKVTPVRGMGFDKVASRIYRYDEVMAVYLMSGGFDLTVVVEGKTIKEVAHFVSDKLATLESVLSTATHFVLKKYKDYGVIFEKEKKGDERMVILP